MGGTETSKADLQIDGDDREALEIEGAGEEVASGAARGAVMPALLGGVIVVIVMAVGGVAFVRYVGSRPSRPQPMQGPVVGAPDNNGSSENEEMVTPMAAAEDEAERGPPVARFMTTYLLGDDLYDDSFSIDDANGDFLGECGMGVSYTIGVGEPKKVCAFEIWLFDKNDVRTVTKVLMSEDAFGDDEKRSALAPKGEPAVARPESTMVLETASLYVTARVVDMQYGSGALPHNSFFHQLTIELAAWKNI